MLWRSVLRYILCIRLFIRPSLFITFIYLKTAKNARQYEYGPYEAGGVEIRTVQKDGHKNRTLHNVMLNNRDCIHGHYTRQQETDLGICPNSPHTSDIA